MSDLLIFALIPDLSTRNFVHQAVVNEGHRFQNFTTCEQFEHALHQGAAPALILIEQTSKSKDDYPGALRKFPRSLICFVLKPGDCPGRNVGGHSDDIEFLTKPVLRRDIERLLERASRARSALRVFGLDSFPGSNTSLSAAGRDRALPTDLILDEVGENRYFLALSPAMREIYRQVKLLEGIDVPVLILGESGTGKEVIAHLLHKYSRRKQHRFVNVNCAALPNDLLESELFGHVRGAFTGAISDKPGKFEQSSGGTILLDEIGEMSAGMQAKLLHVLQDGQFTRIGAHQLTKVDVHVLAATNISIDKALADRTFREDLFYRLNTFTINVPPLRERTEEIPFLVNEMIWRTPAPMKRDGVRGFSPGLMSLLPLYDWPGNLRELRNFVTRTLIMQDETLAIREMEQKLDKQGVAKGRTSELPNPNTIGMPTLVREVRDRTETRMIEEALLASGWNRREAARNLNISYRALLYKIQRYRLDPRSQRMAG